MQNSNDRTNNFDFVRLVAASSVIVGHAFALNDATGVPRFFHTEIGLYAVKVFFVLSGYLVIKSWLQDPNPMRFLARRVLRIFPALIVVVLLSMLLLGPLLTTLPLQDYFRHPAFISYAQNIALYIRFVLPGVFVENAYPSAVNGSLWSLPAEMAMYLMVPIIASVVRRENFRWLFLAITIVVFSVHSWILVIGPRPPQPIIIYATDMLAWLSVAPYFLVGGCLYLFRGVVHSDMGLSMVALCIGLWCADSLYAEPLLILITSYVVVSFAVASTSVIRRTGRFGDISYGVYLYGFPIQQVLASRYYGAIGVAGMITLTLAASYCCAFLSWHLIERRALGMKRNLGHLSLRDWMPFSAPRPAGSGRRGAA